MFMKLKPLDDAGLKELLSQPLIAKLATTSPKGNVRISPLWFRAEPDGSLLINTFEDSAPVKNLRKNGRASVLVDSRDWPYYGVHYWGTGAIEGPENDEAGIAAMFAPYVGSLEGATEYAKTLISYGKRVYIRFRPARKTSYDFRQ
jgi:hypothetical protein